MASQNYRYVCKFTIEITRKSINRANSQIYATQSQQTVKLTIKIIAGKNKPSINNIKWTLVRLYKKIR